MKPLINLALRTEYSFRQTYGKIETLLPYAANNCLGIADINNTYGHAILEKECEEEKIKPIFGTRLEVVKGANNKIRGLCGPQYIFIAKNEKGFKEINELVAKHWKNFYYKPMTDLKDVNSLSENVFVIAPWWEEGGQDRIDYIALTPSTPFMMLDFFNIPKVYINDNYFSTPDDRKIYQLMAGNQKRGDEYNYKFETKRAFQHILSSEEFYRIWKSKEAIENTYNIAEECNVKIPKANMVKYHGNYNIHHICHKKAQEKGINLESGIYAERFSKEMKLIVEKEYVDYFMIVWEMIQKAKQTMLVGPSRGSSAGSLVCYLMGITEVDPIKFDLVFERFIDINRNDLPDIDIDFPQDRRQEVIEDLFKTHGEKNVCHIANINAFKARSAIDDVSIALRIPKFESEILKDSIVDRSGGDARAKISIKDTLETTEVGRQFVEKYPAMKFAEKIQGHATHAGKHAAGVIVCNDEITKFGAINSRDGCIMMDKKGAEYLNLLKIDALGLRTLSILQDCANQIGMNYLDYYNLPLDDKKTYKIFKDLRLSGVFQFEGRAMKLLCEKMGVEHFDDIVVITALARPGPLQSGGSDKFTKRRIGIDPVEYICNHPEYIEATKDTYGIIVYQEQLMQICRNCGNMSWEDVSSIRKAASKTLGKEFFNKYKEKFFKGATENGISEEEMEKMWESMMTFGSWAMNKSHTVSYGYISYWCAYMKANYPLEFTVANIKHTKDESSVIKILRDAYENDGIEYCPVDPDISEVDWSVKDGKILGGLKNIKRVAEKKAQQIIQCRSGKKKWTPSLFNLLANDPKTPYDTIYPCRDKWGDIYENPRNYGLAFPPSYIKDINGEGTFVFIGKIIKKDLRDLNEYNEVMKRGGKIYETNNKSLKFIVEDDTDQINCSIGRFDFDSLNGPYLAESLVVDESWVIVRGTCMQGWRFINVKNIFDLKELEE